MNKSSLYHYGIKGMKWGIRRTPAQLGHMTSKKKTSEAKDEADDTPKKKRSVKDLSDSELQSRIRRLELEKRYKDLSSSSKEVSRGRKFTERVLERAGENIATQFTTYVLGTAVNKTFASVFNDPSIINPKKGQKD